ncbi:MAG: Smr/MutS family protein [Hyphomonadaceae bacterium]
MSKSKRELHPEEKKLWRRVAATVKTRRPLSADDEPTAPPSKGVVALRSAPPTAPEPRPAHKPSPPPANRANEKRIRRGKIEIGATLDLHGHTQESGRAALGRFLAAAHRRGDGAVIVVTGVGRGGAGILKQRLPDWLAEPAMRSLISGYAPAHRTHGGAGAFYVFIKRPRDKH